MANMLYDLLFAADDDRPFLILPDGAVITRHAFASRVAHLDQALAAAGLGAGQALVVQIEKCPDVIALYAACLRRGGIFVPLNPALPLDETAGVLGDTGAKLAIAAPDKLVRLRQMTAHEHIRIEGLSPEGTGSFTDLIRATGVTAAAEDAPTDRAAEDPALVLYHSGGQAQRRGVVLSHGALAHNARALVDLWQIGPQDVVCHALPLFQAHGLSIALHAAAAGGAALYFLPRYDPQLLADALPHATILMGVPSHYTRLLQQRDLGPARLGRMRLCISGSAPLAADTHAAFARLTGHEILDRFATTETGVITAFPAEGPHPHGKLGRALPGVGLRIANEDGLPLAAGVTGLVETRGPAMFSAYLGPTGRHDWPQDMWFATGDLGHLGPTGELTLVGSAQDQILTGGFTVDPAEVEAALNAHADVSDSAVIGLPHPAWGETVVAVVVPHGAKTPDPEELLASLDHSLARFKRPRHVVFTDHLPRNARGGVRKDELRRQFAGALADL